MKRKRRSRGLPHPEPGSARTRGESIHTSSRDVAAPAAESSAAKSNLDESEVRRVHGLGCTSILAAGAVTTWLLFAICIVVSLLIRFRSAASFWPSPDEVGLSRGWAVLNGGLLIASGAMIWLARRASWASRRRIARAVVLVAMALGLTSLGIWLREHRSVFQRGIAPWNVRGTVFPQVDLDYVYAVKERLKILDREREDLRTRHPDRFDEVAKRQLDVVLSLQSNLVNWTEQEIGHWLDDTEQRWAAVQMLAYQVHPSAVDGSTMRDLFATERSVRNQRRQWLILLREHCQTRLSRVSRASAPSGGGATNGSPDGPQPELVAVAVSPTLEEAGESLMQRTRTALQRLGGADWAFARAVLEDPADAVLIGERLNQIQTALARLDAREVFLQDDNEPLAAGGSFVGLNQRFAFLRLPVYLPSGRAWAARFIMLSGSHALMLLCGSVLLVWLATRGGDQAGKRRAEPAVWFWWLTIGCGLVALTLLYAV